MFFKVESEKGLLEVEENICISQGKRTVNFLSHKDFVQHSAAELSGCYGILVNLNYLTTWKFYKWRIILF